MSDDYVLHLASFKHKRESAYSCMVVGGQVEQWQLDLLQDFINKHRFGQKELNLGAKQPEEKSHATEFI